MRLRGGAACLLAAAVVLAAPAVTSSAPAHDLGFTRTAVVLLPDGGLRIDMLVDLDALALGVPQDSDDAELVAALEALSAEQREDLLDGLRQTLLRRMRIRVDGETFLPEVSFPEYGTERARGRGTVLGLTVSLTGTLPAGATEVSLQPSRAFPPLHVSYVDLRARALTADALDELVELGEAAPSATMGSAEPPGGTDSSSVPDALLSDRLGDLVTLRQILERGERSDPYRLDRPPPQPGALEVAAQYLVLGFEHILPLGIDHILFVLGLFLLNTDWRPLLAQVSAFTVAHTLTLGLSTYGVVSLTPAIVEPLIALSIAWVAFENVWTAELKPWRPAVVFGFGLLHGLGFAGVLAELGLPRSDFLTALLSFNIGVELGQLAVIGLAFLALGAFHSRDWYRTRITVPLSLLIGLIGLYWAVERVLA